MPTLLVTLAMTPLWGGAACTSGANDPSATGSSEASSSTTGPAVEPDPRAAARAGLYDTTWPVPTADTWRTSSIATGGLPDDLSTRDLVATSVEVGPAPMFGITHDDALFVLGGATHLLDLFTMAQGNDLPAGAVAALADAATRPSATDTTAYVARIDPDTMHAEVLDLPLGTTPNYPGSLVAHENGMLYVVATATVHEIDPRRLEITRSLDLPRNPEKPDSTIYNTMQVSARNGDLLAKTAPQQGNGLLVAVDVEQMEVRNQLEAALSSARMTALVQGDVEYVYLPGDTDTLRFSVTDDGFAPDPSWSAPYRTADDGTKPGVAMTPTGAADTVVFPNNNTVLVGVTAPLEILWQSTTEPGAGVRSVNPTMTDLPGGSFAPPPSDPYESSIVVAADAVNGRTAAWGITEDGSLENLWVTDRYAISVGAAIVADQHRLYTDDRQCNADGTECTLHLVVLDLLTGEEIARVEVAGSQPSIGRIFVGPDAVYYIATQGEGGNGYVTSVSAPL
jgi:hypothetical protein